MWNMLMSLGLTGAGPEGMGGGVVCEHRGAKGMGVPRMGR